MRAVLLIAAVLATCFGSAWSQEWEEPTEETQKLTASDGGVDEGFGWSVAVFGGVAIVGAYPDYGSSGGESAYVFRYDPDEGDWVEEQKLTASTKTRKFGRSVAIFGEVVVVGAFWDNATGAAAGAAYVFRYDPDEAEWMEEQKLTASDGEVNDQLGVSVAVSGDVALLGAHGDDDTAYSAGSAYVFRYDPVEGDWVEEQKLTASDGGGADSFGYHVAVSGNVALVAAYGDDDAGSGSGSAYMFRYDPDEEEWAEEQKLTASDAASDDGFGSSVAISGDVAVVGAWRDDNDDANSGSAYVFVYDPVEGDWVEEQKLTASDAEMGDRFGYSVAISADIAVIGAHYDDDNGDTAGSAYMFRYDPDEAEWIEERKLTPSDGTAWDEFGVSVAVSADVMVVGADHDDDDGNRSGSAYVFNLISQFLRGDVDGNGEVSGIPDALFLLNWGFLDDTEPPCFDAADVDDSGEVQPLADAILLLSYEFGLLDNVEPPSPGPDECGVDPTEDDLGCSALAEGC